MFHMHKKDLPQYEIYFKKLDSEFKNFFNLDDCSSEIELVSRLLYIFKMGQKAETILRQQPEMMEFLTKKNTNLH